MYLHTPHKKLKNMRHSILGEDKDGEPLWFDAAEFAGEVGITREGYVGWLLEHSALGLLGTYKGVEH